MAIACLAGVLFINYNVSVIKVQVYIVTILDNIGDELFSCSSSSSLIKAYSYDLLKHPDAEKLQQMLYDYKKNNKSTVSCKLEDAKLHPYHAEIKLTALISFPRSGNTWLRTLIEKSTGYQTSSVYCDTKLPSFKAECIQSNRFLKKTHEENITVIIQNRSRNYDQFIYLVRNPFDAILSYYQYAQNEKNLTEKDRTSHEASLYLRTSIALSSVSITMVKELVNAYYKSFRYWQSVKLPHIDIRYEDLRKSPGIILRYVRMFLVPVSVENCNGHINETRPYFSYYSGNSSIFPTINKKMSKYIEEGDKTITCATHEDVLGTDFVYKSNKYESLHSLKYFSNSTINYIIQSLLEPLCYFQYDILFKNKLNIPCEQQAIYGQNGSLTM
jgi:hypothetical protein